jgi:predicted transcriptional regulator
MSRLKTEYFRDDLREQIDKLGISVYEVERRSGVNNSGLYRILNGQRPSVDRSTLRALADAVEMDYEIRGDRVTLFERMPELVVDENLGGESLEGRIVQMMKKMDVEHLIAVDKLVRIIATMDGQEVVDLVSICEALDMGKNKKIFLKKLRAFADILIPYEAVVKDEDEEKSEERLFRQN